MKRCIGNWIKEDGDKPYVAELIIDGNYIEFYSRDGEGIFPCAFIGSDGEHQYKIFTNGRCATGVNRTLEYAGSYRTSFVLQQNCSFPKGLNINGIREFSFIIPELIDWLDIKTIDFGATENEELYAEEYNLPPVILREDSPHVEIRFESETFSKYFDIDTRTTFVLRNQPRVFVEYDTPEDVFRVQKDIESLMEFWGLMIGRVSIAEDIRLTIEGQEFKSWLYFNYDFSYNLLNRNVLDKPRTTFEKVNNKICSFFSSWLDFCYDENFDFILRMYFSANRRKSIFAEDILVQYVRILEGYHLRTSNDEETSSKLNVALKQAEKEIKKLIFTDDGKAIFSDALETVIPDWKFNSRHATDVAGWIAAGYLGKVGLEERIKALDADYFGIIAKNAKDICKLARATPTNPEITEGEAKDLFYKQIVATRNYFSHYKPNRNDVLEFGQMNDTIRVLKALIIMILFSHMGMDKEAIRKIMIWDSELNFQTMCLRKDGERPEDALFDEN